jgi:hypothetical protein
MAPPPADQQQAQAQANAVITEAARAELASLWPLTDLAAPGAVAAVKLAYAAVAAKWGAAAATSAAEHYDELRITAKVRGLFRATPADPVGREVTDKTVESAFKANPAATDTTSALPVEQRVPVRLADSIGRHVLQPARDTIVANGAKDPAKPKGWARVPTSDHPCAFCVLMASRTHLYTSRETARGKYTATGTRPDSERYHSKCNCIAVPVFTDAPPSQQDHRDMYAKAAAQAGTGEAKKILAAMRQLYDVK